MKHLSGLIGLAFFGLFGCANPGAEQAHQSAAVWEQQHLESYVYVVRNYCYCGPQSTVRIVVQRGVVTEATALESGLPMKAEAKTMTELLAQAQRAAETSRDFEGSFDSELGYVQSFGINKDSTADDSSTTVVSCFAKGIAETACPLPTLAAAACKGTPGAADPDTHYDGFTSPCANGAQPVGRITGTSDVCCPAVRP